MSTNMNFGPEWMRGNLPKRSNVLDSSRSNSPTTPIGNGPTKLASNQHPTIQRQHSILDGLTVLDQNSVLTPQSATSSYTQDDQPDNPYKYSKEFMLSLFKPYALPVEIEKHEYVIVEECQQPLAKVELTESEKKLLSGPVHSNVSRKRADNASEQSTDGRPLRNKGEFVNSPAIEKDTNSSRFGLNRNRGRQTDSSSPAISAEEPQDDASIVKANPQSLGQTSSQIEDRNRNRGDQRNWNSLGAGQDAAFDDSSVLGVLDDSKIPSNDPSGTPLYGHPKFEDPLSNAFDSANSGFKDTAQLSDRFNTLGLGNSALNTSIGADLGSKAESPRGFGSPAPLSDLRKAPEEYQWYYRDPTGLVQGPFGAQDMHDWFKAGFFSQTLLVKREDEISFEPLAALIRKIGDDDKPFLTPYNPQTPSAGRSALDIGIQQQPRMDDPFSRSPFGIPGGGKLASQPPLHHQPEMLLQQQLPGSHFGNLGNLGGGFFRQLPNRGQSPSGGILGSYGSFGSGFFGNAREPGMSSPWGEVPQKAASPHGSALGAADLFGNNGINPALSPNRQHPTPQSMNPLFNDPAAQGGFLDHSQRSLSQQQLQHQQYMQMLQQKQIFQQQQFQQQQAEAMNASMHALHQRQQQQPQTSQEQYDIPSEQNVNPGQIPSAPGSEMQMKKPSGFNGWSSNPGTPLFSNASWDPIVSTPTKNLVDDNYERRSAVQSPAISPPKMTKSIDSLKMIDSDNNDDAILSAKDDLNTDMSIVDAIESITNEAIEQPPVQVSNTEASVLVHKLTPVITAPAVKPVSLREIQEEELRKQKEAAKLQTTKVVPKASGWVSSTPWSLSDDTPKGPSLREIQEMEARETESRKILEKQTSAALFSQTSTASGPTTMSWGVVSPGRNAAPATSSSASNVAPWAATNAPKKTLREIQLEEEEEARKRSAKQGQQQAASLAAAVSASSNPFQGTSSNGPSKGYAGIVGNNSVKQPASQSSWTTVASNRSANKSPISSTSGTTRSAWDTSKPQQAKGPSAPSGSATAVKPDSSERKGPSEEFFRWCRQALKGLDSNVDCEDFMQMLVAFPLDNSSIEIIQDMIYANSTSLDGRRFADEFMKRRKADLAGKLTVTSVLPSDEDANAFKVVSKKKKFVKA